MTPPEFSRPIRLDTIGTEPHGLTVEADAAERAALATRFDLIAIDLLQATADVSRAGDAVTARGRVVARLTQRCTATDEPVPATIDEPFALRFEPASADAAEVELSGDALDVVEYDGAAIDLGEAVAETMALALDPFPRAPGADEALRAAGVVREGEEPARGALAGLGQLLSKK